MPHSRARSTASATSSKSSLLQDVPGAFPGVPEGPFVEPTAEGEESTYLTLSQAVHARRAEYVKPKHVRVKIGTWNVAACKGVEKDVGGWFVDGKGVGGEGVSLGGEVGEDRGKDWEVEEVAAQEARYERKQSTLPEGDKGSLPGNEAIGLYVLGLQEVVDITSATGAFYPDTTVVQKWKDALEAALPKGYALIAEQQLIGLLLLIYASRDVAGEVKGVSTTSVGTGLMGYMGNKGAVTARLILGETTRLVFINSHLGAGADKTALERRNWDADQIVQRTRFEPIRDVMDLTQAKGEQIGEEDFAFWCGDLNYRLEGIPGEDVRRLLMLHTRDEYDWSQQSAKKIDAEIADATEAATRRVAEEGGSQDSSSSSSARLSSDRTRGSGGGSTAPSTIVDEVAASDNPTSLLTTLNSLLSHDELQQQMKARKAFHDGWREGPIDFLPTYKYDPGTVGVFDSSEKKRAPSWCDRILYRTRREKLAYEATIREEENAKKKDEEMRANGTDVAGEEESILYDYDPEADGGVEEYDEHDEHEGVEDGVVVTKEGFEDEVQLEYYTAHQRVLSSDHKPLDAIFRLKYDAVVPELKARIHAEVARDLDKAENEGRPSVTVVVDQHNDKAAQHEETNRGFEGVWFGDVRWAHAKHRGLTVANTGRVAAKFSFIERPVGAGQAAGIAPSWLNLTLEGASLSSSSAASAAVMVEPGDTVAVELDVRVLDMSLAQALNEGLKSLDDILVLRVEGGRDHFVPVRGRWLDTSLGQTIDRLIRIPEGGIRKLQGQRVKDKKYKDKDRSREREGDRMGSGGSSTSLDRLERERSSEGEGGDGVARGEEPPVRFSAPRELFRLTEAVEEMISRVVAEWEMTRSASPSTSDRGSEDEQRDPPWMKHPAWPFDPECWTERSTAQWTEALSEGAEALDTDAPLATALPAEMPRLQRLYVLANLLTLFLESMPDGIITASLWSQLDAYLAETEKLKRRPSLEEQRTSIQEIMAQEPSHSISFILITSMLDRVIGETSTDPRSGRGYARTGSDTPSTSPGKKPGALRRMTGGLGGGRVPAEGRKDRREVAAGAMARCFAKAVVRVGSGEGGGSVGKKGWAVMERRRVEVVEVFLKREEG